jgi:hypothetical protein
MLYNVVTGVQTLLFRSFESGKTFKLFARELTERGKALRLKQKESFKNTTNDSEIKEA